MRTERLALLLAAAAVLAACGFEAPDYVPPPLADPQAGCAILCHGDDTSNAPPKSISMAVDTTSVSVGAHRSHLKIGSDWHRRVQCADCHVVPETVDAPGHQDGDNKAEVTFGMVAGPDSAWNGTTCTTGCHGSMTVGGTHPTPTWTLVDQTQITCGSCHGRPPPAPHPPAATGCASCHPTMEEDSMTFRVPERHIDGIVDKVEPGMTGGCASCHGTPGVSSGPPKGLGGTTLPNVRGVGAHMAHRGTSAWHATITCSSCHLVPDTQAAPGHIDGDNVAEIDFTNLNRRAAYATLTATCTNLYCHGNGQDNNGTALWIVPGKLDCTSCHSVNGNNMSGAHAAHITRSMQCSTCHSTVINADRTFKDPTLHVNGVHEVKLTTGTWDPARDERRCSGLPSNCHGPRDWERGNRGPGGGDDGDRDGRPGGGGR